MVFALSQAPSVLVVDQVSLPPFMKVTLPTSPVTSRVSASATVDVLKLNEVREPFPLIPVIASEPTPMDGPVSPVDESSV